MFMCGVIVVATKKSQRHPVIPATPEPVVTAPPPTTLPLSSDVVEMAEETVPRRPKRSDLAKDVRGTLLVVDKRAHTLEVFYDGEPVKQYGVAVGKNIGDKERVGDMRTPEGEFPIVQIQNSSGWTHDFHDGKGKTRGAYGPYFIRLGTPGWSGIGIHGTHAPGSIGTDVTEGCIRLNNNDIAELKSLVKIGDKVVIRD
jgi:lipoprotein-anchoring transpeptidase ErfK/SrfK